MNQIVTAESLFKYTGPNGESINGGQGQWFLPKGRRAGKWMPKIQGDLVPCKNGYHLCRVKDLLSWNGPALWLAETRGERIDGDNKVVVREARLLARVDTWNERTQRLFACDCAERVLPIFEKKYPNDDRPRQAIETARRFANGDATKEELSNAREAAWNTAGAVAWAVAGAVVGDAKTAERQWQADRLLFYLNGGVA